MTTSNRAFGKQLAHRVSSYRLAHFKSKKVSASTPTREDISVPENKVVHTGTSLQDDYESRTFSEYKDNPPSLTHETVSCKPILGCESMSPTKSLDLPSYIPHGQSDGSSDLALPLQRTIETERLGVCTIAAMELEIKALKSERDEHHRHATRMEHENCILHKRIEWHSSTSDRHKNDLQYALANSRDSREALIFDYEKEHDQCQRLESQIENLIKISETCQAQKLYEVEHLKQIISTFRTENIDTKRTQQRIAPDITSYLMRSTQQSSLLVTPITVVCLDRDMPLARIVVEWLQAEDFRVYSRSRLGREFSWCISAIADNNCELAEAPITCYLGVYYAGWDTTQQSAIQWLRDSKIDLFRIGVHPADTHSLLDLALPSASEMEVVLMVSARNYAIRSAQNDIGIEQLLAAIKSAIA